MRAETLLPGIRPRSFVLYRGKVYFYLGIAEDGLSEIQRPLSKECIRVPLEALTVVASHRIPVERLQEFWEYPPQKQAVAQTRLNAIRSLIEMGPTTERIQSSAKDLGVAPSTVARLLDRYLLSGQRISALIPRAFSYGLVNRKLTMLQRELLDRTLKEYYLRPERPTQQQTIERVQRTCRNEAVKLIGKSSVIRALQQLSGPEATAQRLGVKAAREVFRAHRGKAPVGDRPLGLVEVDHTPTDIFVLLPSGKAYRPWITVAIDTFSRMVLGFYLSPEAPSQLSVGLCLYRSVTHKAEWLRHHGITADWPCYGRWHTLVTDNAKEFRGYYLQEISLEHDLSVSFRGIGSPNWGSHIERLMGLTAREMHMLPGTCFSNPVERGTYNPAEHAVLTLEELELYFLNLFVNVYHSAPHAGLGGRCPLSAWNDYFAGPGSPETPHFPQVRAGQDLLISFLPHFRRTIQQDGVSWEGNQYFDTVLAPYIRQPNPKRADKLWRFHFDPRNIQQIWFKDPATGVWFPIPLRDATAHGVTLWDLQDYQAKERLLAAATIDQEAIDRGRNAMDAMVRESQSLKAHRRRKRRQKEIKAAVQEAGKQGVEVSPPSPSVCDLMTWSPAEAVDPSIWDEHGAFMIEPIVEGIGPGSGEQS